MDERVNDLLEQIKSCLERTMHDFDVDEDGDLYVRSGLETNTWISVPGPDFIKFFSFFKFKDDAVADETRANALVNRINYRFFPNSVSQRNGRLVSIYYLPVMDGFSERNFIQMLRRSAQSIRHAVIEEDTHDLLA